MTNPASSAVWLWHTDTLRERVLEAVWPDLWRGAFIGRSRESSQPPQPARYSAHSTLCTLYIAMVYSRDAPATACGGRVAVRRARVWTARGRAVCRRRARAPEVCARRPARARGTRLAGGAAWPGRGARAGAPHITRTHLLFSSDSSCSSRGAVADTEIYLSYMTSTFPLSICEARRRGGLGGEDCRGHECKHDEAVMHTRG